MYENQNKKTPQIGDIYMVTFEGSDSEQKGYRPALVFQNNVGNTHSPNVIVLPLTSKIKKTNQPTHVFLPGGTTGLKRDSMVLCENPTCISKQKLGPYVTTLSGDYMGLVAQAHLLATSAIAFIDPSVIMAVRDKALSLNASVKTSVT